MLLRFERLNHLYLTTKATINNSKCHGERRAKEEWEGTCAWHDCPPWGDLPTLQYPAGVLKEPRQTTQTTQDKHTQAPAKVFFQINKCTTKFKLASLPQACELAQGRFCLLRTKSLSFSHTHRALSHSHFHLLTFRLSLFWVLAGSTVSTTGSGDSDFHRELSFCLNCRGEPRELPSSREPSGCPLDWLE